MPAMRILHGTRVYVITHVSGRADCIRIQRPTIRIRTKRDGSAVMTADATTAARSTPLHPKDADVAIRDDSTRIRYGTYLGPSQPGFASVRHAYGPYRPSQIVDYPTEDIYPMPQ
jgi:hypothetical protein